MAETVDNPIRQIPLSALFLKFLRFGCLAFGGPVAQIAMLRIALVEQERWITSGRFNRLLAVLQILPGPEAHEFCVHMGMIARGRVGGLLAGLGFMLPGFGLMLVAGWLYVTWMARVPDLADAFLGVQIVVLSIMLRAIVRIGQHVIEDRLQAGLAIASLVATSAGVPFWMTLLAAGLIYAMAHRLIIVVVIAALTVVLVTTFEARSPIGVASAAGPVTLLALFIAGLKGGLLTFGGAYTAIPYVRADTVGRGWIGDAAFLDGVALGGVLPAPLVIFATFVGYVAGGFGGALVITAGMFLPAFAFSLILFERLEALVENPALHRWLAGIAAAVVGIIAVTFVQLGQAISPTVNQPVEGLALFGLALAVIWYAKGAWVTPVIVTGGGIAGWLAPF